MLLGIGTDVVEISRIEEIAGRTGGRFLQRVFTAQERASCDGRRDRFACYAARFAGKEAVLKAMGTGLSGCRWTEVEIAGGRGRPPSVHLTGQALMLAGKLGISRILVSLSHDRERSVAFAVALGGDIRVGGDS